MSVTTSHTRWRGTTWRQRVLVLLLAVAALVVVDSSAAVLAQEELPEIGVQGVLSAPGDDGRQPLEGVTVSVTDADGNAVGETTTDAEGNWVVEVPSPGEYTVTVDAGSLPSGLSLRDGVDSRTLTVSPQEVARALFPVVAGEEGGAGAAADDGGGLRLVLQLFVEGVKLGLLIAMMAIGLSLVFGTTGLVNFAHGEMVTWGAILAFWLNVSLGLHLLVAALIAIVVAAISAGLLDLAVFRQLRSRGVGLISQLVITIGLSLLFRYGLLYLFGGDPRSYAQYAIQRGIQIGPVLLPPKDLWSIAISVIVLVGVGLLLQRTKIGRAMRAVADNRDLAESSGIDVQRVILVVWATGGGLAALGGIMWGVGESVSWIMGFRLLLPIFAGVILGGIGTAYGALVGSLVVGVFIQMSTLVIPSELKNAAAMLVLAIILVFRPQGILGRAERIG
jgi:neutral amino acid transport system permease protein